MTVMQAREVRLNFVFSIALSVLGLAMWTFGLMAQTQGWFLPEYVRAIRGSGGAILLVGLIWLMLTAIRPIPALRNLLYAGIISIASLALYMFGSGMTAKVAPPLKDGAQAAVEASSGYGAYLKDGGLAVLSVGLIWVGLSLIKLMVTPAKR